MKILHISTSDSGGAANACIRLHKGLLKLGIDSKVLVFIKKKNIANVYKFSDCSNFFCSKWEYFKFGFQELLNRIKLFGRSKEFDLFSSPKSLIKLEEHPLVKEADIINLHWVTYFLDYKKFFKYINEKKIVWTLHDMNPFTGGCHHSDNCENYKEFCESCPQLVSSLNKKVSVRYFDYKKNALNELNNLITVSPSKWLRDKAQKSTLFGQSDNYHIFNGHDDNIFNIHDKNKSRKKYNLPLNKTILLFITSPGADLRKGWFDIYEAFTKLINPDVYLCIVGKNKIDKEMKNIKCIDYVNNENSMSELYSAADVYVLPTKMDNLPNTIIESLYCGTPVISYPVGGVPEMIEYGKNGLLCQSNTIDSLKETLTEFIKEKYSFDSIEIREQAINKYGLLNQAKKYLELYNNII